MTRPHVRRRNTDLQLESVARISSFPIVESSIYIAGNVYEKIKRSSPLMGWGLDTAEQSLAMATATALPAVIALNIPIMTIDQLLCKGIDIVEQRVPAVNLPPHLLYWNTREYVNNKFVKPVLIRADSVKMIGSQAANAAVERLNGAINVADQYVDRYLPADPADKIAESKKPPKITVTDSVSLDEPANKAVRTIEHGARFSRKLQRRLTRRTLAEARALKEQGTECIHVLLYVVELLATDPKLAMQKAKELWISLSLPEPENQARPSNLEQLLVLFTRETARRIVHLVNGTVNLAARTPRRLTRALIRISHLLVSISEQALKVTNDSIYQLIADIVLGTLALEAMLARAEPKLFNSSLLSLIAEINIIPTSRGPKVASFPEELEKPTSRPRLLAPPETDKVLFATKKAQAFNKARRIPVRVPGVFCNREAALAFMPNNITCKTTTFTPLSSTARSPAASMLDSCPASETRNPRKDSSAGKLRIDYLRT